MSSSSISNAGTTEEGTRKIRHSLNVRDLVLYGIAGSLGLDTLGAASSYGGQALFWLLLIGLLFFAPYQLLMAELGSTFPRAGGVYEWGKISGGRFYAALAALLYWIANPLWIGGTMFVTVIATIKVFWFGSPSLLFGGTKTSDAIITIVIAAVFIWAIIGVALTPISVSKWLSNLGASAKLLLIGLFVILALVFFATGHASGAHLGPQDLLPVGSWGLIVSAIIPLMVFKWQGFEVQVNVGDEVSNPQRDVPRSLITTGGLAAVAYVIPIVVTIFALSRSQIASSSGLQQALSNVTIVLPAPVADLIKWLFVPLLIIALGASGATWIVSATRAYAVAARDYAAPHWLARFNPATNAPRAAIVTSGVIATAAMVLSVLVNRFSSGTLQSLFVLVIGFTISVNTLAYLFIFPDLLLLRYKQPGVKRPYRVPGGLPGAWLVTLLAMFFTIIVSFFLLFPTDDAIQSAGVSRLTYETTQLVTLAVIILLTIVFYLWGQRERAQHEHSQSTDEDQQPNRAIDAS